MEVKFMKGRHTYFLILNGESSSVVFSFFLSMLQVLFDSVFLFNSKNAKDKKEIKLQRLLLTFLWYMFACINVLYCECIKQKCFC